MIPYTTNDYKKYVYAKGESHISRIGEIVQTLCDAHGLNHEDANDLYCLLYNAGEHLWLAAFVDDHREAAQRRRIDWARPEPDPELDKARKAVGLYDDGRTVATTVRFGDAKDDYVTHVWHPDSGHPDNQPGAVIEFSRGPYPFRIGRLKVTAPGAIRVLWGDERNIPEDPDLTESQSRILEALRERERKGMVPSHTDAKHLAQQLAMTEQQIIEDEDVLEALGLISSPLDELTVDQKRLLYALPHKDEVDPSDPSSYPSDAQLVEQLGMSMDELEHNRRALQRLGWMPDSSTDERAEASR